MDAFFLKQAEQHVPVRRCPAAPAPAGRRARLRVKRTGCCSPWRRRASSRKTSSTSFTLGGSSYTNLPRSFRFGPDDPEGRTRCSRHGLDISVHPGGHAAVDIRVGALQHQTDAHRSHAPFFSMWTGVGVGLEQVEILRSGGSARRPSPGRGCLHWPGRTATPHPTKLPRCKRPRACRCCPA